MTKLEMFADGIVRMKDFCHVNGLSVPKIVTVPKEDWRFDACAYYRKDVITICIERCAPIGRGGRAWSYPGYQIDRTPYGVMQHELGHHVDFTLSEVKGPYWGEFSQEMRRRAGEPKLTGYCPNDAEWFAEMFRLFATNPDLLRYIRPRTYQAMVDAGLKPVETRTWCLVLQGAPERTYEMAHRRIIGHG